MDGAVLSSQINDYGNFIITDCNRKRTPQDEANLRLIAHAVNSHATLVAALEEARRLLAISEIHHGYRLEIDKALAKARE